jgi:anti-anti-sigma factor
VSSFATGESAFPSPHPPKAHPFRLGVRQDGATLYLRLTGVFDWSCVGRVEGALERLSETPARRVVFDLMGLSFLDVAGLRTLLRANERARTERFELVVVRPTGLVKRIFTLTRAGTELRMVDRLPGTSGAG